MAVTTVQMTAPLAWKFGVFLCRGSSDRWQLPWWYQLLMGVPIWLVHQLVTVTQPT